MKTITRKTIYEKIFNQEFIGNECQVSEFISFEFLNSEEINVSDKSTGCDSVISVIDAEVYNYDGEVICFVRDLDLFEHFVELNVCESCNGDGYYESDESYACSKPASECCGGCSVTVQCECEIPFPYND
jgi:hypothetical protein